MEQRNECVSDGVCSRTKFIPSLLYANLHLWCESITIYIIAIYSSCLPDVGQNVMNLGALWEKTRVRGSACALPNLKAFVIT